MKTNRILTLIAILLSFTFIQCTTDYDVLSGPAGAQGLAGADGAVGADGVDGSAASCISCHSNTHRDPIYAAYELSGHASAETLNYAGPRASCARCHSNEGYVDYITKGAVNPAGYYGLSEPELVLVTNDNGTPDDTSDDFDEPKLDEYGLPVYSNEPVPVVSPISCDTCHGTHLSFDFENDGNDFALRGLDPVYLITDNTMIDFGNKSNVCISCHQPRRTGPTDDGAGNFRITSSHWGPHHGPQATLYQGIQGAEISGSVPYPEVASSTHRQGASCTSCHMGTTDDGSNGLHTWKPSDNSCTECHTTIPTVSGLEADMAHLGELLETSGALHYDDGWHPVPGTYSITVAEAAWNFLFVYEDMSNGVHNPAYAKALISNSIEALE